jgi:hypothetical protein
MTRLLAGFSGSIVILTVSFFVIRRATAVTAGSLSPEGSQMTEQTVRAIRDEITDLERAQWEAFKKKDKATLAAMLADDYLDFGSDGRWDKAKSLRDGYMAADPTLLDFAWEDLQFKLLDANTALLTYRGKYREKNNGKENTGEGYYSSLYQERNGKWLTVFTQDSNLKCAGM